MSDSDQLKIGLLYGTDTGNTEDAGIKICDALSEYGLETEMIYISDVEAEKVESFDALIMGIPTWNIGGIQGDWEGSEDKILNWKLSGKMVALYGLGDQEDYADYFLDAMGWLNERILKTGATVVGAWPTESYTFDESLAASEDKTMFCGLGLDDDVQMELTDERIKEWVELIVGEMMVLKAA